ncbi:MAG: ribonuclease H-like YkuK family protein, partial [Candidatus Paceibacterota bacterium]
MYNSPTYGKLDETGLKTRVSRYMSQNKDALYRIIVGSDSQKNKSGMHDFVAALVIHRVGEGGIYFWKRDLIKQRMSLKERMYREALMSLESAEHIVELFRDNGISKYNVEIHVDIGQNGLTRDLITEIVGMVRANGYAAKIKP